MKKFYKVVFPKDGRKLSCMRRVLPEKYVVEYLQDEWVSGPYPLMVFGSLNSAVNFMSLYAPACFWLELWECEVKSEREARYIALLPGRIPGRPDISKKAAARYIKKFWEDDGPRIAPPIGTHCVDAVKLVKQIILKG